MSRLFIAVEIKHQLSEGLARVQNELKRYNVDVRWVAPENIHLTIRFLGETEETLIDSIKKVLNETTAKFPVPEIDLREIGTFPSIKNPRVIWIGCKEKGNILSRLYESLENQLQGLGLNKDDHPFSPHLTLGRVKSRKNIEQLRSYIEQNKTIRIGSQKVSYVTLFQSILMPSGPIYTRLDKFSLWPSPSGRGH